MDEYNKENINPIDLIVKLGNVMQAMNVPETKSNLRNLITKYFSDPKYTPSTEDLSQLMQEIYDTIMQSVERRDLEHLKPIVEPQVQRSEMSKNQETHTNLIETHENIIVRADIPSNGNRRFLKVGVRGSKLLIKWGPRRNQVEVVDIPGAVIEEAVKANYKDGILEVTFMKDKNPNIKEIDIQYD